MENLRSIFIVTLILALISPLSSLAQTPEARIKEVMEKFDAVGVSVAVVKDGKRVYTHSFGLKDIDKGEVLSDGDVFRIASISKSFSATAIMQLVEAGKVSLDDDFSKLVGFKIRNPKFPNTVITLKMVLSHTSSINDTEGYFDLDAINPDKNNNWENCYNDYEPGTGYQYCNLNFNMVGAVIEKLSGERFDNYIKQHILNPLHLYGGYNVDSLDASRFTTLYEHDVENNVFKAFPSAYASRANDMPTYKMGYSTPIFSPTGGMKMSANDLATYMQMHMNYGAYDGGEIISEKSAKVMQTIVAPEAKYGLAFVTMDNLIPGKTMVGHTGSAYGLYSAMFFEPEEKFGFVVITNGCRLEGDEDINDFLKESIQVLYTSFLK